MLIKCSECGREISDKAKSCPGCGAPTLSSQSPRPLSPIYAPPLPVPTAGTPGVATGCAIGCGAIIFLFVALTLLGMCSRSLAPSGVKPTPTPSATRTQTPEQKARTARIVMGALSIKSLRASLRDPDSLVIESVWGSQDALYSCIWYRARNGFGGMNRDHVVFSVAGGDQSTRGWNKHCSGRGLDDVTRAATILGDQPD